MATAAGRVRTRSSFPCAQSLRVTQHHTLQEHLDMAEVNAEAWRFPCFPVLPLSLIVDRTLYLLSLINTDFHFSQLPQSSTTHFPEIYPRATEAEEVNIISAHRISSSSAASVLGFLFPGISC